jgi:beta-galactosidase
LKVFLFLSDVSSKQILEYIVLGTGDIFVTSKLYPSTTNMAELPRFGMNLQVNGEFRNVSWYGRGPWENYQDRKSASFVGLYKTTVDELFTPYVRPQENGYRTDVRWFTLTGESSSGLLISGAPLICFSALRYTYDDMKGFKHAGKHPWEMEKKPFIDLNVDYLQQGVGGDDSWWARVHPQYTLPAKEYSYTYRIRPYDKAKEDPAVLGRERFFVEENQ